VGTRHIEATYPVHSSGTGPDAQVHQRKKEPDLADLVETFEAHRSTLLGLAYRMLGDMGRAEDMVQEAWLRWQGHADEVETPKAFLVTVVTRLCLTELDSARARREESRGDRLPEPIDLEQEGLDRVEAHDRISMAFLVVLQKLTPAERAVLLLREIFEYEYAEIATLLHKSEAACRQLLRRARENVAAERRTLGTSPEEHRRLLRAFLGATRSGDIAELTRLLADDAIVIADGGVDGVQFGSVRNLPRPLSGVSRIAAFFVSASKRGGVFETRECELNGQPAVVALRDGRVVAALLISVADGKIRHVFIQGDPAHLGRVAAAVN
jgi:RNA polymerase sigma-70 factor (ECF subfamily)